MPLSTNFFNNKGSVLILALFQVFLFSCTSNDEQEIKDVHKKFSSFLNYESSGAPNLNELFKAKKFSSLFLEDAMVELRIKNTNFKFSGHKNIQKNYLLLKKIMTSFSTSCLIPTIRKISKTHYEHSCDYNFEGEDSSNQSQTQHNFIMVTSFRKVFDKWKISMLNNIN